MFYFETKPYPPPLFDTSALGQLSTTLIFLQTHKKMLYFHFREVRRDLLTQNIFVKFTMLIFFIDVS
jgi:hypothetical protein